MIDHKEHHYLIDTNENILADFAEIEEVQFSILYDKIIYKVKNKDDKVGIYDSSAHEVVPCVYEDLQVKFYAEDAATEINGFYAVLAQKEDYSIDVYFPSGKIVATVEGSYFTSQEDLSDYQYFLEFNYNFNYDDYSLTLFCGDNNLGTF